MSKKICCVILTFVLLCTGLLVNAEKALSADGVVIAEFDGLTLSVSPDPFSCDLLEETDTRDSGGSLIRSLNLNIRSGAALTIIAAPAPGTDSSVLYLPLGREDRMDNYEQIMVYSNNAYLHGNAQTVYTIDTPGKLVVSHMSGMYQAWFNVVLSEVPAPVTPVLPTPDPQPTDLVAIPNSTSILVDGVTTEFSAYLINDSNYLGLRDIAYIVNGSQKQFEVTWDGSRNAIFLISGQPYTVSGIEMSNKGTDRKSPMSTSSTIYLDGLEIQLEAYFIDNLNYFKLRDIGEALDFNVSWINNTVVVNTNESYDAQ